MSLEFNDAERLKFPLDIAFDFPITLFAWVASTDDSGGFAFMANEEGTFDYAVLRKNDTSVLGYTVTGMDVNLTFTEKAWHSWTGTSDQADDHNVYVDDLSNTSSSTGNTGPWDLVYVGDLIETGFLFFTGRLEHLTIWNGHLEQEDHDLLRRYTPDQIRRNDIIFYAPLVDDLREMVTDRFLEVHTGNPVFSPDSPPGLIYPRRRKWILPLLTPGPIDITPDASVLNLNAPSAAVNREIRPAAVAVALALPSIEVNRVIAPAPAVVNLAAPDASVNQLVTPDPAVVSLAATTVQVDGVIELTPGVLNLNIPAGFVAAIKLPGSATVSLAAPVIKVSKVISPDPAVVNLAVPAVRTGIISPDPAVVNLAAPAVTRFTGIISPDPAVVNLAAPAAAVNREIRPAPVVVTLANPSQKITETNKSSPARLGLIVPVIDVDRVIAPTSALLQLRAPNIQLQGIILPPFLIQLHPEAATVRFGTDTLIVFAADAPDARAMAKSQFDGDSAAAWDEATVTQIQATPDLEGWRLRVVILDSSPVVEEVVSGLAGAGIDDLGLAMAAALNLTSPISGATYTIGTQVLIIAAGSGGDDLGDKTAVVDLLPPASSPGAQPIPGGVVSVTDQGASTDDLSATLAADAFIVPRSIVPKIFIQP